MEWKGESECEWEGEERLYRTVPTIQKSIFICKTITFTFIQCSLVRSAAFFCMLCGCVWLKVCVIVCVCVWLCVVAVFVPLLSVLLHSNELLFNLQSNHKLHNGRFKHSTNQRSNEAAWRRSKESNGGKGGRGGRERVARWSDRAKPASGHFVSAASCCLSLSLLVPCPELNLNLRCSDLSLDSNLNISYGFNSTSVRWHVCPTAPQSHCPPRPRHLPLLWRSFKCGFFGKLTI